MSDKEKEVQELEHLLIELKKLKLITDKLVRETGNKYHKLKRGDNE